MKVEQLYTNCLSEAAYYIESNGEAAIIDPLRDYHQYIEKAKANGATIIKVLGGVDSRSSITGTRVVKTGKKAVRPAATKQPLPPSPYTVEVIKGASKSTRQFAPGEH